MIRRLAIILPLLIAVPAGAHDYWGNGTEVDARTKALCCGQNDCNEVPPEAMINGPGGRVSFTDIPQTTTVDRIMPTPDGRIWRCVYAGEVRCLFAPMPGS